MDDAHLKWLLRDKFLRVHALERAACQGRLEALKHFCDLCDVSEYTLYGAIEKALKYERRCEKVDDYCFIYLFTLFMRKQTNWVKSFSLVRLAVKRNQVHVVEYMCSFFENVNIPEFEVLDCIGQNNYKCIEVTERITGCLCNRKTFQRAAREGNVELMKHIKRSKPDEVEIVRSNGYVLSLIFSLCLIPQRNYISISDLCRSDMRVFKYAISVLEYLDLEELMTLTAYNDVEKFIYFHEERGFSLQNVGPKYWLPWCPPTESMRYAHERGLTFEHCCRDLYCPQKSYNAVYDRILCYTNIHNINSVYNSDLENVETAFEEPCPCTQPFRRRILLYMLLLPTYIDFKFFREV